MKIIAAPDPNPVKPKYVPPPAARFNFVAHLGGAPEEMSSTHE